MENPNLKVLLLGWDETHHQLPPIPAPLGLARTLASQTDLTVVLPHVPSATEPVAGADVTGIGNLTVKELQTAVAQSRTEFPQRVAWKAPAAPYLGATPPAEAATAAQPGLPAEAGQPAAEPTERIPDLLTDSFDSIGEPDTAEANDLDQGATLEQAPFATQRSEPVHSFLPPTAERTTPDHALAILSNGVNEGADLNFRVIQYARFATPLVANKPFEVIYAADWPTWLAAMEIRQRTSLPLVLHVHSLSVDRNTSDDRGWIQELERLALRRADLILVDSEALAHRVSRLHQIPVRRIRVQPVSMSPELLAESIRTVLSEAADARS